MRHDDHQHDHSADDPRHGIGVTGAGLLTARM